MPRNGHKEVTSAPEGRPAMPRTKGMKERDQAFPCKCEDNKYENNNDAYGIAGTGGRDDVHARQGASL